MLSVKATEDLVKVLPIIASGMLGFLGALGSQALSHRYSEKREKQKIRREQFEKIVRAVYKCADWMREKESLAHELKKHTSPSPFPEVRMLQKLYFPELSAEIGKIQLAEAKLSLYYYRKTMGNLSRPLYPGAPEESQSLLTENYDKVIEALTDKCHQLMYKD